MSRILTPLDAAEARWSDGFWGRITARTRDVTVPTMGAMLADPQISPALENFQIAAGLRAGAHRGPPFMDGDFYKWLEAAISRLETDPDPALADEIEDIARLIASVQREDGYLHTPTAIAERGDVAVTALADRFNFETYNLGHLITAGVRHHRVTGSETLLEVARAAAGFLEHLARDKPRELARSAICPSHYMAVIDLYRATDNRRYLDLAASFLRVRDEFDEGGDDNQDRIAVRDQTTVAGHAVRANYLYAGLADLVIETGDEQLHTVLDTLWSDVVATKLSVTGGCGALYDGASPDAHPWQEEITRVHQAYGRPYQLPHTTAHNETCAQIGMILWSERMLALRPDARYADIIENIAYNALLSGIGLEGSTYFYTNPLRQVRELPFALRRAGDTGLHPVPAPPPSDERLRESYLSCFCCPPNIARTLAQFHERIAAASPEGLWVHQYGGSRIRREFADGRVIALEENSDYPWDGRIVLTVTETSAQTQGAIAVHLRIPGWAREARVTVEGVDIAHSGASTYARIERAWTAGERIVLDLPMPVRLLRGHRLAEELTGQVAVQRGPVVYCIESTDLPDGIALERVALRRTAGLRPVSTEIAGTRLTVLETEIAVLPPTPTTLYGDLDDEPVTTAAARLVPYFAWSNRGASEMTVWMPVIW